MKRRRETPPQGTALAAQASDGDVEYSGLTAHATIEQPVDAFHYVRVVGKFATVSGGNSLFDPGDKSMDFHALKLRKTALRGNLLSDCGIVINPRYWRGRHALLGQTRKLQRECPIRFRFAPNR